MEGRIRTTVMWGLCLSGAMGLAAEPGTMKLTQEQQTAVVAALSLVRGYGAADHWVRVEHASPTEGEHQITVWLKHAKSFREAQADDPPAVMLALVQVTKRNGAKIESWNVEETVTGFEQACLSAVAYRAQQGWLPADFWMHCTQHGDETRTAFWNAHNRHPGGHCTVTISPDGIRFRGGR